MDGVVIGNYEDFQKLSAHRKYLMLFIQTNNRVHIRQRTRYFTCIKELRGATNTIIVKCKHFGTIKISKNLPEPRREFKSFSLISCDEWITTAEIKITR